MSSRFSWLLWVLGALMILTAVAGGVAGRLAARSPSHTAAASDRLAGGPVQ